jgi:hypothetical protein
MEKEKENLTQHRLPNLPSRPRNAEYTTARCKCCAQRRQGNKDVEREGLRAASPHHLWAPRALWITVTRHLW